MSQTIVLATNRCTTSTTTTTTATQSAPTDHHHHHRDILLRLKPGPEPIFSKARVLGAAPQPLQKKQTAPSNEGFSSLSATRPPPPPQLSSILLSAPPTANLLSGPPTTTTTATAWKKGANKGQPRDTTDHLQNNQNNQKDHQNQDQNQDDQAQYQNQADAAHVTPKPRAARSVHFQLPPPFTTPRASNEPLLRTPRIYPKLMPSSPSLLSITAGNDNGNTTLPDLEDEPEHLHHLHPEYTHTNPVFGYIGQEEKQRQQQQEKQQNRREGKEATALKALWAVLGLFLFTSYEYDHQTDSSTNKEPSSSNSPKQPTLKTPKCDCYNQLFLWTERDWHRSSSAPRHFNSFTSAETNPAQKPVVIYTTNKNSTGKEGLECWIHQAEPIPLKLDYELSRAAENLLILGVVAVVGLGVAVGMAWMWKWDAAGAGAGAVVDSTAAKAAAKAVTAVVETVTCAQVAGAAVATVGAVGAVASGLVL